MSAPASDVYARSLSGDNLSLALEGIECASVLLVHPDLTDTGLRACADAGVELKVRQSPDRLAPGEWELF